MMEDYENFLLKNMTLEQAKVIKSVGWGTDYEEAAYKVATLLVSQHARKQVEALYGTYLVERSR